MLQGIGPKVACPLSHFSRNLGKAYALRGGEEVHLQPLRAQPHLFQESLGIVDPSFGAQITLQVMTGALQSAGDKDRVGTLLKCAQ